MCFVVVCILYVTVAIVLMGIVPYKEIVFDNAVPEAPFRLGIRWGSALVGKGAFWE